MERQDGNPARTFQQKRGGGPIPMQPSGRPEHLICQSAPPTRHGVQRVQVNNSALDRTRSADRQLIAAARTGDRDAIRRLYEAHASRVFTLACRILGDEDLAQDCAQETWVRALRALPGFRFDARFSTWLHRVTVNTALEWQRRSATRGRLDPSIQEDAEVPGPDGDPLLRRRLEAALQDLPARMRAVIVLHDVEGHTHEEVADILGIAPGTSKSQLFKARARMREQLGVQPAAS